MDYSDELYQSDFDHYAEMKDKLLFGVIHLFTEERTATFSSSTEQYLNRMTHEKIAIGVLKASSFTGLDLAIDTLRVKILFNITSALLNAAMINANKIGREDFINTWDPVRDKNLGNQRSDSKRMSRANASYLQSHHL